MIRPIRAFSLLFFLGFMSVQTYAQVPTGTPPFGSFDGGPDVINQGNLNVHIPIPVLHKAGRGTDFTYDLSYDSSVWYPVGLSGHQTWQPVTNFGWRAVTEAATGYLSANKTQDSECGFWKPLGGGNEIFIVTGYTYDYTNWVYHDAQGVQHPVTGTTIASTGSCNTTTSFPATTSSDGSGYQLAATGASGTVYSRHGKVVLPPFSIGSGSASFTDRNGNQLSVDGSGHFYDTLSSSVAVLTVAGSGTPTSPLTYTFTPPNTTSSSCAATNTTGVTCYTMNFTNYTVATNFGISGIGETKLSAATPLVTSIVLPDGSQYAFTYETTPGTCTPVSGTSACVTGRIASITLPTLGQILYSYSFAGCTTGSNGVFSDGSASCLQRTTPDGTWTYTRTQPTGAQSTTTITAPPLSYDPAANQTVIQFQGIYETLRQVYQGSASSGTLLRSWNTCYNSASSPCTGTAISLPILRRTVIDQYSVSGYQAEHDYHYNTSGGITEQDDYDYGNSGPVGPIRKTAISYASLGNITVSPSLVKVEDGSGNPVASTTYTYDEGTLLGSSGVVQHTSVSGSRGNLTTITYPVSGLTAHYTYWDTGSINTSQDVNGATSTYTYSSNAASCQMAFPTGITEPISSLTRSMAWNCTGGMMTSLTDENNKTVSSAYSDPFFWRPASVTDQTSVTTTSSYTGQTSSELALSFNSGNSSVDSLLTLDKLGRTLVQQMRQAPGGTNFDSIETDYDALGRPSRTTLPYSAGTGQTNAGAPGTTTQYDALGRPKLVKAADLGTTSYTYVNNDVLVTTGPASTGENTKQRVLEYDSLGRLTSVCEVTSGTSTWPGGTCGQNYSPQQIGYWTQYSYDPLGNLKTVTQNVQSSTSQQTRTYGYDAMSRLTSEKNPETSQNIVAYTYDTDTTCTPASKGDLVKKVDAAGNVICFSYDALHRLTAMTYPQGSYAPHTPAKHFIYDSATVNGVGMTNVAGRLAEAYTCTGSCTSKVTDEGFSYTARGEISDVYQSTPNSGGYYHLTQSYWANGNPNQLGNNIASLPAFTYGGIIGSTFGLDGEGRVTQVTASSGQNPVTGVSHNTGSLPTQVSYGSGDNDIFGYDSNTLRMTKFQFNVGTASQSLTGNLTWNPNSTLGQLAITDQFNSADTQTCNYSHDDLVRILTANCGSAAGQSFSYDPFGNIDKLGSPAMFQPTYSSSTNQMTAISSFTPSYDANGNVLADSLHTYSWDSDANSITVDGVGLTFDALDRMVEQNRSGAYQQIVYAPTGAKLALMNGQTLLKAFVPLPGQATAVYTSSGLDHYRHSDWLGSARLMSSPSRGFISSVAYAPFGESYAQSGNADLSFTGQNQDTVSDNGTVSGDYDFPYREYSVQGRWPSPDPAGVFAANPAFPQSWNRYSYVLNNPLGLRDPLGLWCVWQDGTHDPDAGAMDPASPDPVEACIEAGGLWDPTDTLVGCDLNWKCTDAYGNTYQGCADDQEACIWSPGGSVEVIATTLPNGGSSSDGSTLDDRANALANAMRGTGVLSLGNPCTPAAFYIVSASGGIGVAAAMNAQAVGTAVLTNVPQAFNALWRQTLRGWPVANFVLVTLPKKYNQTKAAISRGCNALQ